MKKTRNFKIYRTPKFPKHRFRARFLIAAPKCSVKPLSKAVLKLIYKQIETHHSKSHYFSGVKSFWLV